MLIKEVLKTNYSIIDIYNSIVDIKNQSIMNGKYLDFFISFKYDGDARKFCKTIYDFFKGYNLAPDNKPGEEIILSPSYVIREKTVDVKSLCIFFSCILEHHGIKHNYQLVQTGYSSYYMYVLAEDEYGKPIYMNTDFAVPFDEEYKPKKDLTI